MAVEIVNRKIVGISAQIKGMRYFGNIKLQHANSVEREEMRNARARASRAHSRA